MAKSLAIPYGSCRKESFPSLYSVNPSSGSPCPTPPTWQVWEILLAPRTGWEQRRKGRRWLAPGRLVQGWESHTVGTLLRVGHCTSRAHRWSHLILKTLRWRLVSSPFDQWGHGGLRKLRAGNFWSNSARRQREGHLEEPPPEVSPPGLRMGHRQWGRAWKDRKGLTSSCALSSDRRRNLAGPALGSHLTTDP